MSLVEENFESLTNMDVVDETKEGNAEAVAAESGMQEEETAKLAMEELEILLAEIENDERRKDEKKAESVEEEPSETGGALPKEEPVISKPPEQPDKAASDATGDAAEKAAAEKATGIKARAKNKPEKNKPENPLFSIRNKIILGFFIPVLFMIIIGLSAYQKASDGMNSNYVESTKQTIDTAREYMEMCCSFIEAEGVKYAFDQDLGKYFLGLYDTDKSAAAVLINNVRTNITSSQSSNDFVNNIHIVANEGMNTITTAKADVMSGGSATDFNIAGILSTYKEEGCEGEKSMVKWTDHHDALDTNLLLNQDDYILVYQIMGQNNVSATVVDVKSEKVSEFISGINLGENSIVGFVTRNGREIVKLNSDKQSLPEGEKVFYGKEFFNAISGENSEGVEQITYNSKPYLFFYSFNEKIGFTVCALVPMKTVTGQAEDIRNLTVGLVLLSIIIVIIVCMIIALGIQNNMKNISKKFGEVAEGKLNVSVQAKGHDEFLGLAGSANHMIENTKKLVNKVNAATNQLEHSSKEVENASMVIDDYSKEITAAIGDINEGMAQQAIHAQDCVVRTDVLSNEMQEVSAIVERVRKLVGETTKMINQGMDIVQSLGDRAVETTQITSEVGESIQSLKQKTELINNFVETIANISDQTNLLSLNASIEAARAGESGRGFAVVAEEIRKLADDSAKAAGEINVNVEHIGEQTQLSVKSAERARAMVAAQTKAVQEVVNVFQMMQERMNLLVNGLEDITESTKKADAERSEAAMAVQNISAIIQETASSTELVNEVAGRLLENVEKLNSTANILGDNMDELKKEISGFSL